MNTLSARTNTYKPLTNAQLFMLIALASWTMLFGTFILSLGFARARAGVWPPPGITPLDPFLPGVATLALLASSILIHKGYKAFHSDPQSFRFFWGMGWLLGVFFVGLQLYALSSWYIQGVRASSHIYSSAVYVWIIIHAIHLFGALLGISYKYFHPKSEESLQLWGWFWHFIDVVWLVMFPLLLF